MTIRELRDSYLEARDDCSMDPGERSDRTQAFDEREEQLRVALPVYQVVNRAPNGMPDWARTVHYQLREPLTRGRFRRQSGDLLCGQPRGKSGRHAALPPATCLKCLETAERLTRERRKAEPDGREDGEAVPGQ